MAALFDDYPLRAWCAEYGALPTTYTAVDTETTGLSVTDDKILQLGWVTVKDRVAGMSAAVLINWPAVMSPRELAVFRARMDATRAHMAKRGKAYPWTVDLLQKKGIPPAEAVKRFTAAVGPDPALVAHYGWQLDYPMLGKLVDENGGEFDVQCERMLDTGVLVKAGLIGTAPSPGEDVRAYIRRVCGVRSSPRHSLEDCVDRFGLAAAGAAKKNQHAHADYDAWVVHLLLEKLRLLAPQKA